jgi:hypothetical protein
MNELKILWRSRWLSSINELTSLELQKKSWLDKMNTNPHWSFAEFMNSYFDDLGIDNNYDDQIEKSWISIAEFKVIERWHLLLDEYNSPENNDYDHEAILFDEKWRMVVEQGQEAKVELSSYLSAAENNNLNEVIDFTKYF